MDTSQMCVCVCVCVWQGLLCYLTPRFLLEGSRTCNAPLATHTVHRTQILWIHIDTYFLFFFLLISARVVMDTSCNIINIATAFVDMSKSLSCIIFIAPLLRSYQSEVAVVRRHSHAGSYQIADDSSL
jgi:hypothetical protein